VSGLLIIGAGGHGKVVADTALECGGWEQIAFLDDKYPSVKTSAGFAVLGPLSRASDFIDDYNECLVAIGGNHRRVEVLCSLLQLGFTAATLIHPSAVVSYSASIGAGSVIFANAVIQADAQIGVASIINTSSSVDHDVRLGDGVHISPGAHLGGGVIIGNYSWVGIGVVVRECIAIGDNVMLGAGAAVISDVPSNALMTGVPASMKRSV